MPFLLETTVIFSIIFMDHKMLLYNQCNWLRVIKLLCFFSIELAWFQLKAIVYIVLSDGFLDLYRGHLLSISFYPKPDYPLLWLYWYQEVPPSCFVSHLEQKGTLAVISVPLLASRKAWLLDSEQLQRKILLSHKLTKKMSQNCSRWNT